MQGILRKHILPSNEDLRNPPMVGKSRTEKRRRLAVARFWYEGNSFSPLLADRPAFERREWRRGQDALDHTAQESELRAVIEFTEKYPDWDVEVFRCASASPAGQIDDEVVAAFREETLADLH